VLPGPVEDRANALGDGLVLRVDARDPGVLLVRLLPVAVLQVVVALVGLQPEPAMPPGRVRPQRRPDGAGGWVWNLKGVEPLPYRLPELIAADPIDRMGSRPDFLILGYPVISFVASTHQGSKTSLLGANPDPQLVETMLCDFLN